MPFAGYEDFDACVRDHQDKDDPEAYCAKIEYEATGSWPSEKYQEKFGDDAVIETPPEIAELSVETGDIPYGTAKQIGTEHLDVLQKFASDETDVRRFKSAIDMLKLSRSGDLSHVLSKADSIAKVDFNIDVDRSIAMVFKQDDEFLIWGPASVEIVDKEQDRISTDALDKALPQLLRRAALSYAHTDQLVGRILERFETDEPVTVTIGGKTYKRDSFPTAVIDMEDGDPPALFVAGEVYGDTKQSQTVRQKIESGEIDSYSISGEALVTEKQVSDDMVFNDILEIDLSAVTLCEEGMNQGAKFARIDGQVGDIKYSDKVAAKSEPSFTARDGSVSNPQQFATAVSKSMSEDSTSVDFDPDMYLKREDIELDSLATKEELNSAVSGLVDKTAEAVVKEVGDMVLQEKDIDRIARKSVEQYLPKGDMATLSYIESNFQRKGDEEEDEEDYEDVDEEEMKEDDEDYEDVDEEEEEEMKEDDEEDYEDVDLPEMEDEEEEEMKEDLDLPEMEDEDEMPELPDMPEMMDEEEEEEALTHEKLKDELPSDVWSVVSEYIGDTKADDDGEDEDDEEEEEMADDLEKAVRSILSGQQVSSPGVSLGEDETQTQYAKSDDGDSDTSPALVKWRS